MGPRDRLKEVCDGLVARKFPMTYTFNTLGQLEPHQHIISMKENVMEDFPNLLQDLAAIAEAPCTQEFDFDSNAHHYSSIPASWVKVGAKVGADDEVLKAYSAGRFVTHSFYEQLHGKYKVYFKDVTGEGPYITEEDFHKIVVPLVLQEQAKKHLATLGTQKTIKPSPRQIQNETTPKAAAQQAKQTSPRTPSQSDSKAVAPSTPKPSAQQAKQSSPRTPLSGIREAEAEAVAGLPAPLAISPLAKAPVIPVVAVANSPAASTSPAASEGSRGASPSPTVATGNSPAAATPSPVAVNGSSPVTSAPSTASSLSSYLAKHPLFRVAPASESAAAASKKGKDHARRALNTSAFGMYAFYKNFQKAKDSGDYSHMRASALVSAEVSVILNPTKNLK